MQTVSDENALLLNDSHITVFYVSLAVTKLQTNCKTKYQKKMHTHAIDFS